MALFVIMLWWWRSGNAPLIAEDRTIRSVGTGFEIVDKIYPEVKAVAQGQPIPSTKEYSVTSSKEGNKIAFRRQDNPTPFLTITGEDLKTLSPDDRALIQALEGSMQNLFKQWTDLYPQRNASNDPAKNKAIEEKLLQLAKELCSDLQKIFDHLGNIGRVLEDHYAAMDSICRDLKQPGTAQ